MRIFSVFILSISMVFIGQDIRTDAPDIGTKNHHRQRENRCFQAQWSQMTLILKNQQTRR